MRCLGLLVASVVFVSSESLANKFSVSCETLDECQAKLDVLRSKRSVARARETASNKAPVAPISKIAQKPKSTTVPNETPNVDVKVFLRKSMEDLGSFTDPTALPDATGAEFSWTRDRIARNDLWSAQGFLGVRLLQWGEPQSTPYFSHGASAAYVQFDRQWNSRRINNDIDNLVFGGASELAFANFAGATHYIRARGEVVSSFEGGAKNWDVSLEYQPFGVPRREEPNTIFSYMATPIPLGSYFYLTVAPKFRAEYRSRLEGSSDPIFAQNNHAFRYGPAVAVNIDGDRVFPDRVPWWAQRLHYQFVYGYMVDALTSLDYRYLDTSLTFNLDPQGYVGLTFSYRKGALEATGQKVDIAKVSLTAKFGEDANKQ